MGQLVWRGAVTGLSYNDYGLVMDDLTVGTYLSLLRIKNQFDGRAVGVFFGQNQVGWIPKEQNSVVSSALDDGRTLVTKITNHDIKGDFSKRLFINVYDITAEKGTLLEGARNPQQSVGQVRNIQSTNRSFQPPKETQMLDKILETNKRSIKSASCLEAGRIANNQLNKLVAKKLPLAFRGYADTSVGRLVLANLTQMALEQFRPNDSRTTALGQAMVTDAYGQLIREFNIEGMIEDLLKTPSVSRVLKELDQAQPSD